MQSFLLKLVFFVMIINVPLSRGCYNQYCKASCYFKHSGFDYGVCENNSCKCSPPEIFVFDGVGAELNEYNVITTGNNHLTQNLVVKSGGEEGSILSMAVNDQDDMKRNAVWQSILAKIYSENAFIKEDDLQGLKAKLMSNNAALNYFYTYLYSFKSLENALKEMKTKYPGMSKECEDLLSILLKMQKKNNAEGEYLAKDTVKIKTTDSNGENRRIISTKTPNQKTEIKQTTITKSIPFSGTQSPTKNPASLTTNRSLNLNTYDINKLPVAEKSSTNANEFKNGNINSKLNNNNNNVNKVKNNNGPNVKDPRPTINPIITRKVVKEKKHEVVVEISEETVEDDEDDEDSVKTVKSIPKKVHEKKEPEKAQPPKNSKVVETPEESDEYEEYSVEEDSDENVASKENESKKNKLITK